MRSFILNEFLFDIQSSFSYIAFIEMHVLIFLVLVLVLVCFDKFIVH